MSEEKVAIVRRIYEEWGRGNFRAGTELFEPHTLLVLRPDFLDAGAYLGLDGIGRYMRAFLGAWEDLVIEAIEFIDAGDSIVVGVRQRGTGRGSGAPIEQTYFQLWTFRGGTVLRIENILRRGEALEAAGLQP